jgi:2-keto-4-pentenoate hydratase/2-oxohepta-3-ene-1,7-dioic acid hydratase in catechol pathway
VRLINVAGRAALVVPGGIADVARASGDALPSDVMALYPRWAELRAFAATGPAATAPYPEAGIEAPVPRPPQVFAIGLNYRAHAEEAGIPLPDAPMVFTKFPASVAGPYSPLALPCDAVDFEAELVAVVGAECRDVAESDAWSVVAGLTVGQDLSDRAMQAVPPAPQQFSMAKSRAGFAPIGPAVVTPDEFADPGDLEMSCTLSGELMQKTRTSDLIFGIPRIVAYLSGLLPLLPGDLIFTGTPSGVGWGRKPPRYLRSGDELVTAVEGIGELRMMVE